MRALLIRAMLEADLPEILQIVADSPTAPQWSEAQFREMLPPAIAELTAEPAALVRTVLVAVTEEGMVAGFAVVSVLRVVYPSEAELESIAVAPAFRGRGAGRALVETSLDWVRQNGAEELRLEVRASNLAALGLYRAMDFHETGLRRGYYVKPPEDAVCMTRTISPKTADDVQER